MSIASSSLDAATARIVALLPDAVPRCGATVVVAIDGPSGSGKTTLADALSARMGAVTVHMDELYP
ncbi:MAG: hypothetical protein WAZ15_12740, partial [Propioniciclava sp.]